jgi:hypothetical protein
MPTGGAAPVENNKSVRGRKVMLSSRMVALATVLLAGFAAPALAQDKVLRIAYETEPQTIKAFATSPGDLGKESGHQS